MGQKSEINKLGANSDVFVELHIGDLVKDCLKWHEQVNRRTYPSDMLPSVIHKVDPCLVAVR